MPRRDRPSPYLDFVHPPPSPYWRPRRGIKTLELSDLDGPDFVWPGTPAEVVKLRFREFSAHMQETIHREASAYRVREKNLTIIFCRICNHQWLFTDVGLRAGG